MSLSTYNNERVFEGLTNVVCFVRLKRLLEVFIDFIDCGFADTSASVHRSTMPQLLNVLGSILSTHFRVFDGVVSAHKR